MFSRIRKVLLVCILALSVGCAGIGISGSKSLPFASTVEFRESIVELVGPPVPGSCTGEDRGILVTARTKKGDFKVLAHRFPGGNEAFILISFDAEGNPIYVWGGQVVGETLVLKDAMPLEEWMTKYGKTPCDALMALADFKLSNPRTS